MKRFACGLSDSVETALKWGEGTLLTLHQLPRVQSPSPKSKADAPASTPTIATLPWIETLHSNRNYQSGHRQELRAADAETFFLQLARRRVPGLPRARPENGF